MATAPSVELELDFLVWTDKNGTEQVTPAHTFPSGTTMLFHQTSAPVGWTKSSTHNDKALRVVNGTVTSGGSQAFTSAFKNQGVSGSVSVHNFASSSHGWMASHNHSHSGTDSRYDNPHNHWGGGRRYGAFVTKWSSSVGGNGAHSHGASFSGTAINMAVQYVDVIIAVKD